MPGGEDRPEEDLVLLQAGGTARRLVKTLEVIEMVCLSGMRPIGPESGMTEGAP